MPTTSRGFRYPASSAAPNVPVDLQNLANDVNTWLGYRYYSEGAGTNTSLTTTATAPTGGASLSLPAGTYDFDIWAHFGLDVSTAGRVINLHLYSGTTLLYTTSAVATTTGLSSRDLTGFKRQAIGGTTTINIRVSADATGGTQFVGDNTLRAVRVS